MGDPLMHRAATTGAMCYRVHGLHDPSAARSMADERTRAYSTLILLYVRVDVVRLAPMPPSATLLSRDRFDR